MVWVGPGENLVDMIEKILSINDDLSWYYQRGVSDEEALEVDFSRTIYCTCCVLLQ